MNTNQSILSQTGMIQVETRKLLLEANELENNSNEENFTRDGVTHICIDFGAKTELGRMLSHYYEHDSFIHPVFGSFKCLEGFWRYINCIDNENKRRDEFRTASGKAASKISRDLEKRNVKNFKEIIYAANYHRIILDEKLHEKFIQSTLPFDYYHLFGPAKIVSRGKGYQWIITMYEDLRNIIKNGEQPPSPDYSKLLLDLRFI